VSSSVFCFAVDLVGEGTAAVCERVRAAGLSGITLAASYHEARDYLPHNPLTRVHYAPAGTAFHAATELYPADLPPAPLLPVCDGRDLLAELVAAAGDVLEVGVWAVYLHNDGPAGQRGAVRNAFDDEHQGLLCPSDPIVREYARALTIDLCRPGVRTIAAEAMHGLPFEHGFHHERRFAPLTRLERVLLSLCFCGACLVEGGADARELAGVIRDLIGTGVEVDGEWSREAVERAVPLVAAHLTRREEAVARLADECAAIAAANGVEFAFLDVSAGILGWSTGEPIGPLGVDLGWELGVDVARLAPATRVLAVPYASDPERVRAELAAYRSRVTGSLGAILRPMAPDCNEADNLAAKLEVARELGVDRIDYYHYGMMPLASLDLMRRAKRSA
jgi:hypothetical protein